MAEKLLTTYDPDATRRGAAEKSSQPQIAYSKLLRAIGQDLEERAIESFSLLISGDQYTVREQANAAGPAPEPRKRWWFGGMEREASPRAAANLQYSHENIEAMEQAARRRRSRGGVSPDVFSLSQQLRALGAMIDHKRVTLLRLDRSAARGALASITIQIRTRDGQCVIEQHSASHLHEYCVRMYKARKKSTRPLSAVEAL